MKLNKTSLASGLVLAVTISSSAASQDFTRTSSVPSIGGLPCARFLRGSWRSPIKTTNANQLLQWSCDAAAGGWLADDPARMVEALEATGQNVYVGTVVDGYDPASPNCSWINFEALANEITTSGSPLKLIGELFGSDLDPAAYVAQIRALRELARSHPCIEGVTIDDVPNILQSITDNPGEPGMTRAEFRTIVTAARDSMTPWAPRLNVRPYMEARKSIEHFIDAHVLGMRRVPEGVESDDSDPWKFFPGDVMQMEVDFTTDPASHGSDHSISFLYYERFTPTHTAGSELMAHVSVNGFEIGTIDFHDEPYMAKFEALIPTAALDPSGNQRLKVSVEASGVWLNAYSTKLIYLWDLNAIGAGSKLTLSSASYDRWAVDPDTGVILDPRETMVAQSNEEFRIDLPLGASGIGPSVQGLHVKYDPPLAGLDPDVYREFIRVMAGSAHGRLQDVVAVFWADEQTRDFTTLDLGLRADMLETCSELADGVIVWLHPNHLYCTDCSPSTGDFPDYGIYFERPPLDSASFDRMAYYPNWAPASPGWFQSWRYDVIDDGLNLFVLTWMENRDGTDPDASGFVHRRLIEIDHSGVETVRMDVDLNDLGTTGGYSWYVHQSEVAAIEIQMVMVTPVGNSQPIFEFKLGGGDGVTIAEPVYSTGIDQQVVTLYEQTSEFFLSIR